MYNIEISKLAYNEIEESNLKVNEEDNLEEKRKLMLNSEKISKNLNEKNTTSEDSKTTLKIDEALFPLYLPSNTSLKNRETIKTDIGERVIMTFSGDNPFILVQETVAREKEFTTIPTSGTPYLLVDTVGALTNGSYTWISNGIEYYIVSDVMEQNELLEVAKSINVVPTMNEK